MITNQNGPAAEPSKVWVEKTHVAPEIKPLEGPLQQESENLKSADSVMTCGHRGEPNFREMWRVSDHQRIQLERRLDDAMDMLRDSAQTIGGIQERMDQMSEEAAKTHHEHFQAIKPLRDLLQVRNYSNTGEIINEAIRNLTALHRSLTVAIVEMTTQAEGHFDRQDSKNRLNAALDAIRSQVPQYFPKPTTPETK